MNTRIPSGVIAYLLALPAAHAVTVSPVVITATSTLDGNTITSSTPGTSAPVSTQTFANGGATGTLTATTNPLVVTNPVGPSNVEFKDPVSPAVFASTSVNRGNTGNGTNTISSQIVYQIAFELGVSETADVTFDFNYDLTDLANVNGLITWSLVGPGATNVFAPGSIGTAGTAQNLVGQSITQQTATITTAGTYTLMLTGSVNSSSFVKNQSSVVNFNSIDLKVVSSNPVPEPGSALLGLLGTGLLIGRRRRN